MKHYVIESDGQYIVVRTEKLGSHIYSHIVGTHKNLDIATNYANILNEDGVAVNSVSSGNVSGYSPLLKFKKFARRKLNIKRGV